MPATTIVVLVDEDGDEFPVGFQGRYVKSPQEDRWLRENALKQANELVEAGAFRPRGELKFARIEGR